MTTISDDRAPRRDWRWLLLAVVGPVAISVLFIILMAIRGEEHFAPGEGAGAAARTMMLFALYGVALLAFVAFGATRCRHPVSRTFFVLVSLPVSAFVAFITFFSQMAP